MVSPHIYLESLHPLEWLQANHLICSSNMLYPKEDKMNNRLMFSCRTCQFSEPAASSCVFRNNLYNEVGETAGVTQDVGSDPTVCSPESDLVPFCTLCGEQIKCSVCGEEDCEGMVCNENPLRARSDSEAQSSTDEDITEGDLQ